MKTCISLFILIIVLGSCKSGQKATVTIPKPVEIAEPVKPDTLQMTQVLESYVPAPVVMRGKTDSFFNEIFKGASAQFQNAIENRDALKIQVIYTRIDRQADNSPVFTPYSFNLSDSIYFYPASTVKMPVAAMALQRLNELKVFGLNAASSMITDNDYSKQTPVFNDPSSPDGRPSIDRYIRKIFLASDNDAFNRLYEFLGQQYINDRLHGMGYKKADILHRLNIAMTEDENRHTNGVRFFNEMGKSLYTQPMQVSALAYPVRKDSLGTGYYNSVKLVSTPMPFGDKNRIGLEDLTKMLKSLLFPNTVPVQQRFNLKPDDYRFLYRYMSELPKESVYPAYDSIVYQDAYLKFLLYGAGKDTLPKHIRIFNKSGNAYGFLNDVAYIVDFGKNIEFMLSAVIYCNSDGILNDDKYDYDTIGFPFMKELGQLIYDYEVKRERVYPPNLSDFHMKYDK